MERERISMHNKRKSMCTAYPTIVGKVEQTTSAPICQKGQGADLLYLGPRGRLSQIVDTGRDSPHGPWSERIPPCALNERTNTRAGMLIIPDVPYVWYWRSG